MNKKKVYLFEFHKSPIEVRWEWENISETDKEKLRNIDFNSFYEYVDTFGNYNLISIISELEKISCEKVLKENLIHYLCKDLSQKILRNDIDIISKLENEDKNINLQFFETNLDEWIKENLHLDFVLDLINEKGISSLTNQHKKFLNTI